MTSCLFRRAYDPAALVAAHPPDLRHPHKRAVFALTCPPDAVHRGEIEVTRWAAATLPAVVPAATPELVEVQGVYDYAGPDAATWHVNFADPHLFFGYGSALLAQDELQAAEHPLLGPIREAMLAAGHPALTEEAGAPTPVLVAGVERRCAIATGPDAAAGRPHGLYGNRFAAAPIDVVRRAVTVLAPPTTTHLVCIAAPCGGRGAYTRAQLAGVLATAYTGFAAAVGESARRWPGVGVEICTGFWGCGAFGGNRRAMTALQLLAARLAGARRIRFHAFDDRGRAELRAGAADGVAAVAGDRAVDGALDRLAACGYVWGESDGN